MHTIFANDYGAIIELSNVGISSQHNIQPTFLYVLLLMTGTYTRTYLFIELHSKCILQARAESALRLLILKKKIGIHKILTKLCSKIEKGLLLMFCRSIKIGW